jgi:hypothetical protein
VGAGMFGILSRTNANGFTMCPNYRIETPTIKYVGEKIIKALNGLIRIKVWVLVRLVLANIGKTINPPRLQNHAWLTYCG